MDRRYPLTVNPEQLSDLIVASLADLSADGAITLPSVPETVTVERPRQQGHGDYATNVALQLAKRASMPPRDFAGLVAERLGAQDGIAGVEVAGPGQRLGQIDDGDRERRTGAAASNPLVGMELSEALEQALAPLPPDVVEVA